MAKTKKPKPIATQRELAALVDRDESTISRWLSDERWPFARKAPWPADLRPEILKWMATALASEPEAASGDEELRGLRKDRLRQEIRKVSAGAAKAELELAIERKEAIPVAAVKQWIVEHVTQAKNRLMGMASTVVLQMEGRDAAERQEILEKAIREVLEDLSNGM